MNADDLSLDDRERERQLAALLEDELWPLVRSWSTLDGVREFLEQGASGSMLVTGAAQRLLATD
jgi:hypothetical protein